MREEATQRIDCDEQFHQIIIRRIRSRLHDEEDILAANIFHEFDKDFHIGKAAHRGLTKLDAQIFGNCRGEGLVAVAGY